MWTYVSQMCWLQTYSRFCVGFRFKSPEGVSDPVPAGAFSVRATLRSETRAHAHRRAVPRLRDTEDHQVPARCVSHPGRQIRGQSCDIGAWEEHTWGKLLYSSISIVNLTYMCTFTKVCLHVTFLDRVRFYHRQNLALYQWIRCK